MVSEYSLHFGGIYECEHFGTQNFNPNIIKVATGSGTYARVPGAQGRGGVCEIEAAAGAVNNSCGIAWGIPHQPAARRMVGAELEECMGPLVVHAKVGFPALANRRWFFGLVSEQGNPLAPAFKVADIVSESGVADILTLSTSTYPDWAGFYVDSGLSTPAGIRAVSKGGSENANDTKVLIDGDLFKVTGVANPNDGYPQNMIDYEIAVQKDGKVEMRVNGVEFTTLEVNPEYPYLPIVCVDAITAGANRNFRIGGFTYDSRYFPGFRRQI